MNVIERLTQTEFMPHGYCYLWFPEVLWLHVFSDGLIALAYFLIPAALCVFVLKRREMPFPWIFLMFAAFITACGVTHAMGIWTVWRPDYGIEGLVKLGTAMISIATAATLIPLMPKALALRSPAELEALNLALAAEVGEHRRTEAALRDARAELEERVAARTAELSRANELLQREIEERKRIEATLREREARIHLLLDSTAEAIYGLDLQGRCTFANRACARMLGYDEPADLTGFAMHDLIHHSRPDGTPYPQEECPIHRALRENRGAHVADEVLWRADGTSLPVEYWSHPMREDSALIGCVVTFLDTTERRRAEQQQRLLLSELSHRVKNTLAVVQALAERTGQSTASTAEFLTTFAGRLSALATAHSLLTAGNWQGASLRALAEATLAPHLGQSNGLRLEIDDTTLSPQAAQTFALAFHELATNAAKYGALSAPGGQVTLTGGMSNGADGAELHLVWQEQGGPPVRTPARFGFGTKLLTQAIEYQHEGNVALDWRAEGLVCRISVPIEETMAAAA